MLVPAVKVIDDIPALSPVFALISLLPVDPVTNNCVPLQVKSASPSKVPSPVHTVLAGSFLFGTVFVVTEPISGAKTKAGQWIYGFMIGGLTVVLRGVSNFSEGIMFSVLIMNAFVPLLDQMVIRFPRSNRVRS